MVTTLKADHSEVDIQPNRRVTVRSVTPEIFWSRMQKPVDCWLYDGAKEINGYGYLLNPLGDKPKYIAAHRLAWILTNGEIPEGLLVLHKCDIRACCNPVHLFLGTHADNGLDKRRKNRDPRMLTDEQVREVRALLGTMTQRAIARKMNCQPGTVGDIRRGLSYADVPAAR